MSATRSAMTREARRSPPRAARRSACASDGGPSRAAPAIRRASGCACGGGCPRCAGDDLQRKGLASAPGDALELDADRSAEQALARVTSVRAAPERPLRRQPRKDGWHIPPGLPASVDSVVRSAGEPLAGDVRERMEAAFGADLGSVRVHRDAGAAASAEAVEAEAYAVGEHLAFGAGRYAPGSANGDRLLAHELAHVLQTHGAGLGPAIRRYGQYDSCKQGFLESHIWPGTDLAHRMLEHATKAACGAEYGHRTPRNKEARIHMKTIFGNDWVGKSGQIYKVLWQLRSAFDNDFMYDCVDTPFLCADSKGSTGFAYAGMGGVFGRELNLCEKNLKQRDAKWFAQIVIHEMGHAALSLNHGADDESMSCQGDVDDAQCYALLAAEMWRLVDPVYDDPAADLCNGTTDPDSPVRNPKHWD